MSRLPDIVRKSAQRHPDAIALGPSPNPSAPWTYAEFCSLMERAAAALQHLGLQPGERVLLYMEPGAAWPVALFAILDAGLVAVPIIAELPVATAVAVSRFADAKAAIIGRRTAALTECGTLRCIAVEQLLQPTGELAAENRGSFTDLALLAFTSGSTSQPRAVELTHANLLANLQALLTVRRAYPGDAFLSLLPPAHLFEFLVGLLGPLACGARIIYPSALLPNRIVDALRQERITHALAVPALLEAVYAEVASELVDSGRLEPQRRDQSPARTAEVIHNEMNDAEREQLRLNVRERIGDSLHTLVIGGAALDPVWQTITAAVGLRLEVGYGLTEASPIVSVALAAEAPPGSAGRPLPGVEVRLADDGEVLVRGPSVMRGYYRDAEATAAALRDGWLHTGDCGRIDANGFLFITGRLKEAVVTASGDTLYPEEVEPYYHSPLFAEHCLVGLPGPQGNDLATLFVVPADGAEQKALQAEFETLRAAVPARLRLSRMVLTAGPLPRTVLGKIRRRILAHEWQQRGNTP